MFVRRRGCRLQVIRSYRDEDGKPRHETLGVVGVFDNAVDRVLIKKLSSDELNKLKLEIQSASKLVVTESKILLEQIGARTTDLECSELANEELYKSIVKLSRLLGI